MTSTAAFTLFALLCVTVGPEAHASLGMQRTDSTPTSAVAPVQSARPAKGGPCILDFMEGSDSTRANRTSLPSGNANTFVGGRFIGVCRGQDVRLVADSAEHYGDENVLHLIGRVKYSEPRAKIDSDRATYRTDIGYLHAEGNVYAVTESGNTMRGPVADYYRAIEGIRTAPEMVATGRPLLGLIQRDSVTGNPTDTVHVLADRIRSLSDSLVYAGGDVHITRPDLIAIGDSVFLDNGSGRAQLMINPRVDGRQTSRPFTLTGGLIDVFSTNKQADRIVASPNGNIVSQDLTLSADSIDMRIHENKLQRTMAWGSSGARAVSPDQTITADSIDTIMHDQQVKEIHAIRNAHATSVPDTAVIVSQDRDWLEGDSIIALFDTVPAPRATPVAAAVVSPLGTALDSAMVTTSTDTSSKSSSPPLKVLTAITNARAYYHMENQQRIKSRPGLNYVTGRIINVTFLNRAVDVVTVTDQATGVYLEPEAEEPVTKPAVPASEVPVPVAPTPAATNGTSHE